MARKKVAQGLTGFGVKGASVETPTLAPEREAGGRTRGKGDKVAIAVRLNREDWYKLHDFANRQGLSMQQVIVFSVAHYMQAKGVPPLSGSR